MQLEKALKALKMNGSERDLTGHWSFTPSSCLNIISFLQVSVVHLFANFLWVSFLDLISPPQQLANLCALPVGFHMCSCLYACAFIPFNKVCHCCLCSPQHIFSPAAPSYPTFAAFCWCCICLLPIWGIALSAAWSQSSVVFSLRYFRVCHCKRTQQQSIKFAETPSSDCPEACDSVFCHNLCSPLAF